MGDGAFSFILSYIEITDDDRYREIEGIAPGGTWMFGGFCSMLFYVVVAFLERYESFN
jgi:hypothetical protein